MIRGDMIFYFSIRNFDLELYITSKLVESVIAYYYLYILLNKQLSQ